ncbi:hypothetical protein ABT093_29430 [Kitasatospora sp. NPDC002551]|uniref:hypothetical protein n=1 Tax=Kitasatospora sp. NPDC002551 TaxID=3154539 RepID=UPI0033333D8A
MTLDDSTPAVRSGAWEAVLAQGFGEVLGRPLAEYDGKARYGAYYSGNFLAESELERDPVWVGRAALAGEERVTTAHLLLTPPGDLDETELVFDASRSLFHVDPRGLSGELAPFAADLATAVEESEGGPWDGALPGADLGRIAGRHGVDLASPELPGGLWTLWRARLASGGETLLDALLAATGLTAVTSPELLPAGVGDAGDELDEEAHELAAGVADPALRDFLVAFCDQESHDLALVPVTPVTPAGEAGEDGEDGEEEDEEEYTDDPSEGGTVVVRWDGAVDQYEIVVRRLEA